MDGGQPGVADELETLVCDGKTLRGSLAENVSDAVRFIAQVSLCYQSLGVEIAQSAYATDAGGEIQALRQLLEAEELDGVLVQTEWTSLLTGGAPTAAESPGAPARGK